MKQKQVHKSNWLVTMLLLVMAILMPYGGAWAQTEPSSGDGSVGNPYKISTAAELAWFRDYVNGTIVDEGEADGTTHPSKSAKLIADIDLSEFCHSADAKYTEELSWVPIGNSDNNMYKGTFDGNGNTISNLYINATSNYTGFFGKTSNEGGSIKNITFDNAKVKSTGVKTGILAGAGGSCIENIKTLSNCSVEGNFNIGGIVGYANGDIINCENHAVVKGADFVGGVVGGYEGSGNSITSCSNYGAVTGTGLTIGGMVGHFSSGTIQNSANYGDITGNELVGNLIGFADRCNLNNVLGTGNVTAASGITGLLVGRIDGSSSTASGILAYNSSAKLTINGTEQTGDAVKAIGEGSLTSAEKIKEFTAEQLKSGLVASQLQKNVSGSAKWGQKLGTDDYPLLGSADEVYLNGDVTLKCSGELEGTGKFTNTKPAHEGTFTIKHGDSPAHHDPVAVTCFTDGNIEYWVCNVCHKFFSDAKMTQEVSTPVVSATGHKYDENDKCTMCQKEIPVLTSDDNNITIEKVYGSREEINGYNLYKYTATEDGTLAVTANSNGEDTYGTLWESRTAASYLTFNDDVNGPDFKITYDVTKGTTYYIGAREFNGDAIEGNVTLNVKLTVWKLPEGMTGKGTEAEPFVLKTAEHLAWFRDYVNGDHPNTCAKIADDVTEIDMSTVCHEADGEKLVKELSWTPIGNSDNNMYQGTFDGNGKIIKNLYINATSSNTGFFGYLDRGSTKNITFDNAKVNSTKTDNTGILAGFAGYYCMIENIKTLVNCSVDGNMSTGGIAGNANGNIINCENRAVVKGTSYVGGVVGNYNGSDKSLTSCANYGAVTGSENKVGGMVGFFGIGTLQNCVNYGDVTGVGDVGNLIGGVDRCNLNNVLGIGNVTATFGSAGLLVGRIDGASSTASGILAYNSSAKLTINGTEQTGDAVKAIGEGSLTSAEKIKEFTAEQLKSGLVANQLQKNVSGSAKWGQKLGTDNYPLLDSADEVYLDGDVTLNCLGEVKGTGIFTNTKPAQEGTFMFQHGDSPKHHDLVAVTCLTDGIIEYWECNLCHKSFSDAKMTQEVSTPVVSATGHEYDENDKCTKCQQEIPFLTSGDNNITIGKVYGYIEAISGYNLYKYTATEDGTLEVTANSNGKDTSGTLWESRTAASCLTFNDDVNGRDFKIAYDVTKGTTYYIGARQLNGEAIEGNVTLNVKLTVWKLPEGMTGKGTEAEPFVLKTAEHLAWFRDYVNGDHPNTCAKIADDVTEIDMSTVCHEADGEKLVKELSWTPIGNSDNNMYQGTFDGNGKTISNLYINATSGFTGFFGYLGDGSIKNITFYNARVNGTGSYTTGILAGDAGKFIIENIKTLANCSVEGREAVGGIAGNAHGNIINCENHAIVNGGLYVGGVVGRYESPNRSITSCANYGAVTSSGNYVGGMVGQIYSGSLQNSANYGDITGADNVGNLIGQAADNCNLNNVLGTGNVTATFDTGCAGLLVGSIGFSSSTGILAYSSSAKLTINKTEQTDGDVKAIGDGSLTYPDGKNEADVIKAFTPEQLKSGEVAWLLNGSTSVPAEGSTLAWYQKLLGADADAYPVLVAEEGNTVYNGSFRYCDGTASSYSNSSSDSELIHVASATLTSPEFDSDKHIYHMGCRNEGCTLHKYSADEDGTLKATKSTDDKFYVEELNLTNASTAINTQAQFTVKNLQYSRQLTEGQTGYVTLCLPFDIKAAEVAGADKCYPLGDMMIHMPTEDASVLKFVLMLDEQSDIKAGTPMIVKLAAENAAQKLVATAQNVEYNANFFAAPAAKSLTLRDWDGKSGMMPICHDLASATIGGVYTATTLGTGSYSLREGGKFGIHKGELSPYRVYLNIQTSQSAPSRAMMFSIGMPDDSSTTGIRIINMADGMQAGSAVKSAAIYTLEGQRVKGTPGKGIYIKNGKKFIVK